MEILVDRPLLSLRTTPVFLPALLTGATVGALTVLAGEGTPRGLLAGPAVVGVAVVFFDRLVETEAGEARPRRTGARAGEGEHDG